MSGNDNNVDIHIRGHADGLKPAAAEAKDTIRDLKDDVVRRAAEMAGVSSDLASRIAGVGTAFLAVGAAAYATWKAYSDGKAEIREMNLAIGKTGEYSGQSAASLRALAAEVAATSTLTVGEAKKIETALAASGQIGAAAFRSVSLVAGDFAQVIGSDVAKVAPDLVKLFDDPAKGAAELNRTMHFLSVAELEHIEHLQRTGEVTQAQVVLAGKLKDRLAELKPELGTLAKAWEEVRKKSSEAWAAMSGKLTNATTDQDRLAVALRQAEDMSGSRLMGGGAAAAMQRAMDLQNKINAEAARRLDAADAAEQSSREQKIREMNATTVSARVRKIDEEITFLQRYGQNVAFTAEKIKDLNEQREKLLTPKTGKPAPEPIDVFNDRSFITSDKDTAKRIKESYDFENWAYRDMAKDKERADSEAESRRMSAARITHGLDADYRKTDETRQRAAEAANLTESQKRLADALYEVDSKARHAREALDLKFKDREKDSAEYRQAVADIDVAQGAAAQSAREWAKRQDELNASWEVGAKRALRSYLAETQNVGSQSERLVTATLRSGENAWVRWATTGKFQIKDVFSTLAAETARAYYNKQIAPVAAAGVDWLSGAIGNLFGWTSGAGSDSASGDVGLAAMAAVGGAHSGAIVGSEATFTRRVPMSLFQAAPRFHTGGIVGDEVPIIARRREGVFTEAQMKSLAPAGGGSVTVNIIGAPSQPQVQQRPDGRGGIQLDVIFEKVDSYLAGNITRGAGPMAAALAGTYNLNRAGGGY